MSDDPPASLVNERPSADLVEQAGPPWDTRETQLVRFQQKKQARSLSLRTAVLFVSASIALAAKWSYGASETIEPSDYKARTERILSTTPLIDGHNDLPYLFRLQWDNKIYDQEYSFQSGRPLPIARRLIHCFGTDLLVSRAGVTYGPEADAGRPCRGAVLVYLYRRQYISTWSSSLPLAHRCSYANSVPTLFTWTIQM